MTHVSDNFEKKILNGFNTLARHTFRTMKYIDKEFGISRLTKKMVLALGLKLITLAAPHAQISLHAQNVQKKSVPQLLAKTAEIKENPTYEEFFEKHQTQVIERQKSFAIALWENLQTNIHIVQEAEKKGKQSRTKALRELFQVYKKDGIIIDKEYFCASAGLGSFLQTIDDGQFEEYRLISECLTNPNNCSKIIKDFKLNFGTKKESSDIQKSLADIFKKNPYAVCIVFPHSKSNSRSGYHYVTVFSNSLAVDTLLAYEDSLRGKTARFNRTAISNTEDYFIGERKRGYVFDVSEMIGNYQIFDMFINYLHRKENPLIKPVEIRSLCPVSFQPFSQTKPIKKDEKEFAWAAVGRKPVDPQILLASNNQRMN